MFRLSCAIEENGLLAIGADNTEGLFVSSGYFASLDNDANMAFKERYHNHFGQRAPTLNALGQSTYEGVHFMAALAKRAADEDAQLLGAPADAARIHVGARHLLFRQRALRPPDLPRRGRRPLLPASGRALAARAARPVATAISLL